MLLVPLLSVNARFQKELLTMSAHLLLLTPDHATVFMPNLGIQCRDERQEYQSVAGTISTFIEQRRGIVQMHCAAFVSFPPGE